ncbi:MAG: butyryl-CoA:acetate CoA-transferase [Oscillospiraceae bacterium]|nr:butyryl-CoA:acetate CoA-transferase [Oscillospiraceae bacterium]
MDFQALYRQKLRSPEEAVKLVKDGDWVDYSQTCSFPQMLDKALAARSGELHDVKIRNAISMLPVATVENDPGHSFTYNLWHCSGLDRKYIDQGRAFHTPMLFRHCGTYYRKGYAPVDVAMVTVAPMDEYGNFSFGLTNCAMQEVLDAAKTIILEVNPTMPVTAGTENDHINIQDVDCVVECSLPIPATASPLASDLDRKIAEHIMPYITSGATLQLGIGGIPNAIGTLIAESDVKDLGMHTELMSDGYLALYQAGKITNRLKKLNRGKGVFSICNGSRELYDFLDHNGAILTAPMRYVNNPETIRQLDDFVSINGCIAVDLYGQVSSESSGTRQISGTGGQVDFITGVMEAEHGRGFLTMHATFTDKAGNVRSRIVPKFTAGDIITTPRTQAPSIVTEYGIATLPGLPTWQRAEALINIAHPDFREELIRAAEEQKIWRRSNKR